MGGWPGSDLAIPPPPHVMEGGARVSASYRWYLDASVILPAPTDPASRGLVGGLWRRI